MLDMILEEGNLIVRPQFEYQKLYEVFFEIGNKEPQYLV